jgi:hypothetical protein
VHLENEALTIQVLEDHWREEEIPRGSRCQAYTSGTHARKEEE